MGVANTIVMATRASIRVGKAIAQKTKVVTMTVGTRVTEAGSMKGPDRATAGAKEEPDETLEAGTTDELDTVSDEFSHNLFLTFEPDFMHQPNFFLFFFVAFMLYTW